MSSGKDEAFFGDVGDRLALLAGGGAEAADGLGREAQEDGLASGGFAAGPDSGTAPERYRLDFAEVGQGGSVQIFDIGLITVRIKNRGLNLGLFVLSSRFHSRRVSFSNSRRRSAG